MRLVIDLQGAQSGSRWRGIGRYTRAVAVEIARLKAEHEVIVVLNDAIPETIAPLKALFADLLPSDCIRVWTAPGPVRAVEPVNTARRKRAEIIYEAFIASLRPDVLLIPSLFEGFGDDVGVTVKATELNTPTAVILHDLIPLHDPERYLIPAPEWHRLYNERFEALGRADLLLAVSEFSARDGDARLPNGDRRIVKISAACSDFFKPTTMPKEQRTALQDRLGIEQKYIISAGTLDPNKNLTTFFKAFKMLPSEVAKDYKIVLVGHSDKNQQKAFKKMGAAAGLKPGELILTGYVSDDELVALYSDAALMVFPSTDEGFGLPPLEAMACGTPTIGSKAASIPEVIGLESAMFDPYDLEALSKLMKRALTDDAFRVELTRNAAQQAKAFSWENTAKRALEELADLAARRAADQKNPDPLGVCIDALAGTGPTPSEANDLASALAFDFPEPQRTRHLFVDVSELIVKDARTGCQRVTRSVLVEWLRNPPSGVTVVPVYATAETQGYLYAPQFTARLIGEESDQPDLPIDYAPGDIFFGLDLHTQMPTIQKSALERMHMRGVKVLFFVHDLLPMQLPHCFDAGMQPGFQAWLETIAGFDGVIGNSLATAAAFQAWRSSSAIQKSEPFTVHAVHLGADIESSLPDLGLDADAHATLSKLSAAPSFLMVGTVEPRKGHAQALAAFELLWAKGDNVQLVIVGKEGWEMKPLVDKLRGHPELGKRLIWLERISDEYLEQVYENASCLLAASLGEGFGLPLIEAARHDLPILARDLPVFREVATTHAAYFEGHAAEDIADAIAKWIAAKSRNEAPTSTGMPWLTWSECATRIAEALLSPDDPIEKDGLPKNGHAPF